MGGAGMHAAFHPVAGKPWPAHETWQSCHATIVLFAHIALHPSSVPTSSQPAAPSEHAQSTCG